MSIESDLDDEIRNSQAIIYYYQLEAIKLNYYVFQKNFNELKIPIENMKDPKKAIPIWDVKNRSQLELLQYEVIRRLLNYIFSAKALVDYTRNLISDWYSNTGFKIEYDSEIKSRFTENELVGFIEDLRNYSSHYSLPITFPSFSIEKDNSQNTQFIHSFLMSKSVLLKWNNWEKGIKYLNNAPEDIEIEKFSYDYFNLVDHFDRWLLEKLVELHKDDLEWLKEKNNDLRSRLDMVYRDK